MSRSYRQPYAKKSKYERGSSNYGQRQYRRATKRELAQTDNFEELVLTLRKAYAEFHPPWKIELPYLNYCEVNAEEHLTRWGSPLKTGRKCKVNPKIEAPWGGCDCYLYHNSYYRRRSRK